VPTFVGRSEELRALSDVAQRIGEGPSAAVIVGDPGSGKTRLLAEVATCLGITTQLRVVGYEPERSVPLTAAADLLRLLAEVPQEGPPLGTLVSDATHSSPLEPMRIFEAAHRALDAIEPELIWMDDLQWVDDLSLALCHYVIRAAGTTGQRLAVLAAARPSGQATTFVASLAQLLPPERFTALELGPLTGPEALELANVLAPGLEEDARRDLAALSGGSPFWLEALARTQSVAVNAGQLVTARLRGAGADASALLTLLAVAGRPVALADAATLERWSTERVEQAAADLVSRGVAIHSVGGVRLAHDLIREAAVGEIPTEKRRDAHRRLAHWLERAAGEDIRGLREALDHRHAAGLPSLELATRLARSHHRTLLGAEGVRLLKSIADESEAVPDDVVDLNTAIASLAADLADYPVALERWAMVTERAADPIDRASACLRAARAALATDDLVRARRLLENAREQNVQDELFQLQLQIEEATVGLWSGQEHAPARTLARDVVTRFHGLVDRAGGPYRLDPTWRRAYAELLRLECDLAYQEDEVESVLSASEERAAVARGFDFDAYLAATIAAGRALRRIGRLGEAEDRLRGALREAQRSVLPQLAIDASYWLASVLELQARIAEAQDIVSDAADLAARAGDEALGRHLISRLAIKIRFHCGDWRSALAALREHSRDASPHGCIELFQDGALWLAMVGGEELESESLSWLADATACADKAACPRCGTELRLAAAEVLARTGHPDDAAASLAEWRQLQKRPQRRDHAVERRVEGLLHSATGNGAAAAALDSAAAFAEANELVLDAVWTRIDLGRVLAVIDRERAIETLRDVAQSASTLGAVTEQHAAEKALRALGVRTWGRGRATTESLTTREQEIARLIAEGASNPEIAQKLFLSRKTVERHVSNVFKKIGVRNRAELAAKAAELKVEGAHR
jgi:DNA-binding NarL/FixJ family response regulator